MSLFKIVEYTFMVKFTAFSNRSENVLSNFTLGDFFYLLTFMLMAATSDSWFYYCFFACGC